MHEQEVTPHEREQRQAWRFGAAAALQLVTSAALADLGPDQDLEIEHYFEWYESVLAYHLAGDVSAAAGLLFALAEISRVAATPLGYNRPLDAPADVRAAVRADIETLRRRMPDFAAELLGLAADEDDNALLAEVDRQWGYPNRHAPLAQALYLVAVMAVRQVLARKPPDDVPGRLALLAQLTETLMRNRGTSADYPRGGQS
ncbi:hypothetical protein SUDANB95_07927 (plasmid) [Actinosynnema sp. ALI-1.44]